MKYILTIFAWFAIGIWLTAYAVNFAWTVHRGEWWSFPLSIVHYTKSS